MSGRACRRRCRGALLMAAAALLSAACGNDEAGLQVRDAQVRALIPGQDKTAAYFHLHNGGPASVRLLGAHAGTVRAIEMHETVQRDGVARMRRLDGVEVPAGGSVRFEPGGKHLMLFGVEALEGPLAATLELDGGAEVAVTFTVVPLDQDIR